MLTLNLTRCPVDRLIEHLTLTAGPRMTTVMGVAGPLVETTTGLDGPEVTCLTLSISKPSIKRASFERPVN